jgi:putative ABC transport system permease protein
MWFVTLVFRNLLNRKVRSSLTCLGMGIAVCTVVSLFGVIDAYEGAILRMYQTRDVDIIVSRAGVAQLMLGRLNQHLGDRLRELPGVRSVDPMMLDLVSFKDPPLQAVYIFGWEPESKLMDDISCSRGRTLKRGDKNKLLLGDSLSRNLKKGVGDKILVEETELEIIGIFNSGNVLQDSSGIMPLVELQELMQQQNKITLFMVRVDEGPNKAARVEALCHRIEEIKDERGRPIMSASDTQQHVRDSLELRVIKTLSFVTSFIALFIGIIGMLNTMMIAVFERTREIGTLRAVGWPKSRVVGMIILETLILALFGVVLGIGMSMALTWSLHTFFKEIGPSIPSLPSPVVVVEAILLALGIGLLGALYPAFRASRLLPTEALRHD